MVVTPEEFERAWGTEALVRLPLAEHTPVLSEAYRFLAVAGLPALIRCYEGDGYSNLTFCRLTAGLFPIIS